MGRAPLQHTHTSLSVCVCVYATSSRWIRNKIEPAESVPPPPPPPPPAPPPEWWAGGVASEHPDLGLLPETWLHPTRVLHSTVYVRRRIFLWSDRQSRLDDSSVCKYLSDIDKIIEQTAFMSLRPHECEHGMHQQEAYGTCLKLPVRVGCPLFVVYLSRLRRAWDYLRVHLLQYVTCFDVLRFIFFVIP